MVETRVVPVASLRESSMLESNLTQGVPRSEEDTSFSPPDSIPQLTKRELEVLMCLPTRLSTVEIASRLQISPNTVKTHVKNIYKKLGAGSRNEAIVNAAQLHLLSSDLVALVSRAESHE
jgi:LuxR family transcriptional regulator, maltose regulon positive regulatory protein